MKNLKHIDWDLAHQREQLHLGHETLTDAWLAGYFSETAANRNPHFKWSKKHQQWSDGWWCAAKGLDPFIFYYDNQFNAKQNVNHAKKRKSLKWFLNSLGLTALLGMIIYDLTE